MVHGRDEKTGEVILSPRLSWKEIFAGFGCRCGTRRFLSPEERDQGPPRSGVESNRYMLDTDTVSNLMHGRSARLQSRIDALNDDAEVSVLRYHGG